MIENDEETPVAEYVGFAIQEPLAALVKGNLNEIVYVNFGKGIPIEGEAGKGPHELLLSGLSGRLPDDVSAKVSAIGLYGLLAMQVSIIHQIFSAMDERMRKLEDPFSLGISHRPEGPPPTQ